MSYWVLTVWGHVISCVTVKKLTKPERNTYQWSQQMREYDIEIEWILDVKYAELSKDLAMINQSDEDPEFLDKYNRVISDVSIPNGRYNNDTDGENK